MKLRIVIAALSICAFTACHKNDSNNGGGTTVSGKATLQVDMNHHGPVRIAGFRIFLKKNCMVPPTDTTQYDQVLTTGASGEVQFENLANGNYVLYAKGYDPNYPIQYFPNGIWGYSNGYLVIDNKPGETKTYYYTVNVSE